MYVLSELPRILVNRLALLDPLVTVGLCSLNLVLANRVNAIYYSGIVGGVNSTHARVSSFHWKNLPSSTGIAVGGFQ